MSQFIRHSISIATSFSKIVAFRTQDLILCSSKVEKQQEF